MFLTSKIEGKPQEQSSNNMQKSASLRGRPVTHEEGAKAGIVSGSLFLLLGITFWIVGASCNFQGAHGLKIAGIVLTSMQLGGAAIVISIFVGLVFCDKKQSSYSGI